METESARKQRISTCRGCRMRRCLGAGMKIECLNKFEKLNKIIINFKAKKNINNNAIVKKEPLKIEVFTGNFNKKNILICYK